MKKFVCLFLIISLATILSSWATQKANLVLDDLTVMAQEFVAFLEKGDFSKAAENFDETMSKVMPQEKLKKVWDAIIVQVGSFKKQTTVRTEKSGEYDIVYVTCEFENISLETKVVFDKGKKIAGLFFVPAQPSVEYKSPSYVNTDSFKEKEVVVGTGKWELPATLALPVGKGPFPALALVHGSGPQDRDETIGPNKPFRDLAWGLASKNIAVLRYEKRTKTHGQKFFAMKEKLTVKEETIDDVIAAVELLRKAKDIDKDRIFVLGHSLGGMLIPRIAALDSDIAGFVIMAGTTRPLEDVIIEQMNYIFSLDGSISEDEKNNLDKYKTIVDKIKALKKSDADRSQENLLGAPAEYWLDLSEYNPAEAAKEMQQSMLIMQGGRDYQVTEIDFERWKTALSKRKDVKFKFYPELNHIFIPGKGKIAPAEYQKAGHVAKAVIDDIANWIKTQE